ncbi:MAG: hypothetical protein CMJ25_20450 [Phycisphaerae bacterium]|nr:hypothetical protein [Phycisphaerae bacterium]
MEEINEQDDNVTKVDMSKFESAEDDNIIKVDLSKPPVAETETNEETVKDDGADEARVARSDESADAVEKQEEVQTEAEAQEAPALEEITEEEVTEEVVAENQVDLEDSIAEAEATGTPLPENIQKVVDFMDETGGTLEDYVNLNKDYSEFDNLSALTEYYKRTKPHLSVDEIDFLIEDQFDFDEDVDDEKDIKRKKLALKEQVASAKAYLDGQKSKYYDEVKAGSKLTPEAKKAMDFFNRYNEESKETEKVATEAKLKFNKKTNEVFNDKFKGFEYNVGEKKYRFNVKNAEEVKTTQSDINNFVKKFLNEDNTMSDAKGYHKSLFTAMNPDAIAKHFYDQGKADALKDSVAKSKNVSMTPRQSHGQTEVGGVKFKVLGQDSSDFKFKIKKRK